MNKQIQKLYDQADKFAKENKTQTISGPGNNYFELLHEKFAELIVRECLKQIDKIRDGCEDDGEDQQALGADWAGLAVARHFGVEE